jgi:hypothetical protein
MLKHTARDFQMLKLHKQETSYAKHKARDFTNLNEFKKVWIKHFNFNF